MEKDTSDNKDLERELSNLKNRLDEALVQIKALQEENVRSLRMFHKVIQVFNEFADFRRNQLNSNETVQKAILVIQEILAGAEANKTEANQEKPREETPTIQ